MPVQEIKLKAASDAPSKSGLENVPPDQLERVKASNLTEGLAFVLRQLSQVRARARARARVRARVSPSSSVT